MDKEVPMKTVARFIDLLRTISANGPLTVGRMVSASGMPYPTVSRMVKTMLWHELIEQEPTTKRFRVAAMALSLSNGFQLANRLAAAARPTIEVLTHRIGWPVAILTRVGTSMVTRASTHHLTSLTFGPCPDGSEIPIEHSASGHVFLAHASHAERTGILDGLQRFEMCSPIVSMFVHGRSLDRIRADGYATYERNTYVEYPGKTSSISVPIHHDSELQGTLTLVFFSAAMPMKEALRRYLNELKNSAAAIESELGASDVTADATQASGQESSEKAVRELASTTRPQAFVPTHRTGSARDAAQAFSNLITTELRQGKSMQQPSDMRRSW